jgi:hypothetical protein
VHWVLNQMTKRAHLVHCVLNQLVKRALVVHCVLNQMVKRAPDNVILIPSSTFSVTKTHFVLIMLMLPSQAPSLLFVTSDSQHRNLATCPLGKDIPGPRALLFSRN